MVSSEHRSNDGAFNFLEIVLLQLLYLIHFQDVKRPKAEGLLDADDLAFLNVSAVTSPAISDGPDNNNDSSNEALVVDLERSGSNTPGKWAKFLPNQVFIQTRANAPIKPTQPVQE